MMQYDPLSILTPFLLKSAQKWDSAALKTKSSKGGLWGGSENDNLVQIFYFTWYFIDFSVVICLKWRIHSQKFGKNRTIHAQENGRFAPN